MEWLSYGSRLWFGQLTTSNVTVFIDFSYEACFKDSYIDRVKALNLWYFEQLQLCEVASISFFGSTVIRLNRYGIQYMHEQMITLNSLLVQKILLQAFYNHLEHAIC